MKKRNVNEFQSFDAPLSIQERVTISNKDIDYDK